jgi:hypothetical protein
MARPPIHTGCLVEGCTRKHGGRGYCHSHYNTYVPKEERERKIIGRICSIAGCGLPYYAKNYCRNHYAYYRSGGPDRRHFVTPCAATDCIRKVEINDLFCARHLNQYHNPKKGMPKGETHYWWKGGLAEYPDQYRMKVVRRELIKENGSLCQLRGPNCTHIATDSHHKDGTKTNHEKDNIMLLCHSCHMGIFHSAPRRPSKKSHYGKKLSDWSCITGLSASTICNFFKGKSCDNTDLIMRFALEPQLRDQMVFLRRNAEMAD